MQCRGNQSLLRTVLVRALAFSAVAALILNPAMTPVVASDYRVAAPVAADGGGLGRLSLTGQALRARAAPDGLTRGIP